MKHLTSEQLSAHLDRALSGKPIQDVELHLAACAECRDALAELEALDRRFAQASMLDPGDAYFEDFAARVEQRLQAVRSPARSTAGVFDWVTSPRRVALAGGVVALAIGAALAIVVARNTQTPTMQRPDVAAHSDQVAPPRAATEAPPPQTKSLRGQGPADPAFQPVPVPPNAERTREEIKDATTSGRAPRGAAPDLIQSGKAVRTDLEEVGNAASASRARKIPERGAEDRPNTGSTPGFARAPESAPQTPPTSAATPARIQKPKAAPLSDQLRRAAKQAADLGKTTPTTSLDESRSAAESAPSLQAEGLRAPAGADRVRVCGRVVDDQGRPLAGANVAVAEFGASVVTNRNGSFCLETPGGEHTLVVMSVGFETVRRQVTVAGGSSIEITMHAKSVLETPVAPRTVLKYRPTASDSFASWPEASRDAARDGQRFQISGVAKRSASELDRSANAWARAAERSEGTRYEIVARERHADARFRAWEIAPTRARAQAAVEALTAYIARAPLGNARENAARRLDRVKR